MKYYIVKYNDKRVNRGANATTRGFIIYIRESARGNRRTLEHEKCHVRQNYLALLLLPLWLPVAILFRTWLKLHKEAQAFVVAECLTNKHILTDAKRRDKWVTTLASHTMKHYAFYKKTTFTKRRNVINYHIKKQLKE